MQVRLAAGFAATLLTQQALVAQQPPFRAETRLVVLHATVQNGRGELVTSLDQNAFTVYENGHRQAISIFRKDDIPVSLGLLIDNSGSMLLLRSRVEAGALKLARASNPQDEIFVLNFADKPKIDVPFTSDTHVLEAGIARVDSIGGTALRDAVAMAESYVSGGTRDRKVLVVITDGKDNASLAMLQAIREQAEQHEIVVYAIALGTSGGRSAHHEIDELARQTGGAAYYAEDVDEVETLALDVARQIRSQYTIAYTPENQTLDNSYREIKLTVTAPERLSVRTRSGYRATPIAAAAPR
jgi:VWFA-related protein